MVVKRQCSFCAAEIEPGTGWMFVKRDGTVYHFCSSSCRKQQLHLGRVGHRFKWTRAHALRVAADRSTTERATPAASPATTPKARRSSKAAPAAPVAAPVPAAPAAPAGPTGADTAAAEPPEESPAPTETATAAAKPKPRPRARKKPSTPSPEK